MKKLILLLFVVLFTMPTVAQTESNPNTEAWREDLDYLYSNMKRIHPNLFFRMPEEEWDTAAQTLHDNIPNMTDDEIIVELIKFAALADGHTGITPFQDEIDWHMYPVQFYWFSDGLYVTGAAPEYQEAIGKRVVSVGNMSVDEAYEVLKPLVARDNEYGAKLLTPIFFPMAEVLLALDVIDDVEQPNYIVEGEDGEQMTLNPSYESGELYHDHMMFHMLIGFPTDDAPLYLTRHHDENFWFTFLEDSNTLYVQHNLTYGTTQSGITMSTFTRQIEEFINTNEVDQLVLDLRHNPGGNNHTYKPLLNMLRNNEKINQRGKLFVLTGRTTFSAAADFVMELLNDTEAILAGEPMATGPNHYGENVEFRLPNSNIMAGVSTELWVWSDIEDTGYILEPDIRVDLSSEDYFNGRDPVLEAVINYER